MELAGIIAGIVGVVFIMIFGGRGLIDPARGYAERRRARLAGPPGVERAGGAAVASAVAVETRESASGPTPVAAVVGREFRVDVLQQVANVPEGHERPSNATRKEVFLWSKKAGNKRIMRNVGETISRIEAGTTRRRKMGACEALSIRLVKRLPGHSTD